jgi:hypothetical protein
MKGFLVLLGSIAMSTAFAQAPDVSIKLNLYGNYRSDALGRTTTRLYDPLGNQSLVGLIVRTDLGFQLYASEKLEIIPHGGDPEYLDEYYVTSPGNWKVGKQYLPFGQNKVLHETALAVKTDWDVPFLDVVANLAACEAGPGRQQGVIGRIGDHFGVSFAVGEHFGIEGTSFDNLRLPTQAPGAGRGYREIFGVDYGSTDGPWRYETEAIITRAGNTSLDQPDEIFDAMLRYSPSKWHAFEVGWTHSSQLTEDVFRAREVLQVNKQVSVEPMVRVRNGLFYDLSVTLHVKF